MYSKKPKTLHDHYARRINALTGGSVPWKIYYQGFQNTLANPGRQQAGGGNAGTFLANCLQVLTTATASDQGSYKLHADQTTGNQPQYEIGTAQEFYTGILLRCDFAGNTQARVGLCGLANSTSQFSLGFDGSISTTSWSLKIDGAALLGGTYVPGAWTRLDFLRLAGLTTFYVNGVAVASSALAFFGAAVLLEFGIANGTSAVARNGYLSELVIAHPSPRSVFP